MSAKTMPVIRPADPSAKNDEVGMVRLTAIAVLAFLTLTDLFAAQALLPSLTAAYGVTPAVMGLAVNASTFGMAAGALAIALLSHRLPRRAGIVTSLMALAPPTLLLAVAPDIETFAGLRVLQGVAMSAAFGLSLAYLGERYAGKAVSAVFAAYITGNVGSNLVGRLIATTVADHAGLGAAFVMFSAMNIAGAILAFLALEAACGNGRPPRGAAGTGMPWSALLADARLCAGYGIGFAILFAFIGIFTFVNFVLTRPPLSLGMMGLGAVYFVFLPAIVTTPFAGRIGDRLGTRRALWLTLTTAGAGLPLMLATRLPAVLTGMALVAVGTFAAQALATGYVSRTAKDNRGGASGIYLACYFLGGLTGTAVLGPVFDNWGWAATLAGIGAVLLVATALTSRLR